MAEVKNQVRKPQNDPALDRAKDFWTRYGRIVMIASGAIILIGGGWLAYKYFVQAPKEQKAAEAIWKAEDYFIQDSVQKTLKGDGQFAGAEKIASQYSGTPSGNLANYYAGAMALKAGEFDKAVKYLKAFSTDSRPVQARAYKLLGDAYANTGKNSDALSSYKNAARENEKDEQASAEYLFYAAYFADRMMNDKKQATPLYQEIAKKYSRTQFGPEAERYLAQAGVYKSE